MAVTFLKILVHYDVKYNVNIVKYFLQALINESITIRKTALRVVLFILVQNKPRFKKIEIDPYSFSKCEVTNHKTGPGIREDNKWLLYDSKTIPKSAEAWDEPRFLHDHSTGFYAWPTKVEIYAPSTEQPNIDKRFQNLSVEEKEIYNFFNNPENLQQFIEYFSMEEKKGKDQFNAYKFLLFKVSRRKRKKINFGRGHLVYVLTVGCQVSNSNELSFCFRISSKSSRTSCWTRSFRT